MATIEKIPAIRFKNFKEDWEEKKLGEIGDTFTGLSGKTKDDFGYGSGRFITYMNVFSNPISNINQVEPIEVDKSQNLVKNGDVFFTTSSETPEEVGLSSVWLGSEENIYLNSFCFGYRPILKLDNYYLAYMLRSYSFRKKITFLAQGISRYNISKNKVMEIPISHPILSEQAQIGTFFKELDEMIRLQEQKHKKIINLKKVMLEKMFPVANADVPEIRFNGFTEKWERKTLEDVFDISSASRVHKHEWTFSGVPFFRSSDVVSVFKGTENTKAYISDELYNKLSSISGSVKKDDILITGGGSIGIPYLIKTNCPLYFKDADLLWIKNINSLNGYFIYTFFLTTNFRSYIESITHIGTISHYTIEQARKTPISLPNKEEQQKIGQYFQNLDQLISQSQQKIQQLKNLKQAFLQKMFI